MRGKDYLDYGETHGLTLSDPLLQGVYRSDGVFLPGTQNNNGLGDSSAIHTLRFNKGGTFYISVSHGGDLDGGGIFELSLIDIGLPPVAESTCTKIDVDNLTFEPGVFYGK